MDGYVTIGTQLDLSGIEHKLDDLTNMMDKKASSIADQTSKKMSKGLAIGVGVMSNVVNRLMSTIGSSISGAISRTDTLNNFSNVMSTLGVSSKDASDSINYMSEKLLGLPTTLDQGAMAVKRFTSANNNVKASTEMFLALNNAILAGGAPMQQQAMALEQMSQAYAKNRPDMMEWRTVMTAMPAQLNQVAKAMGFMNANGIGNSTALGEALRKGEVSMNDFMMTFVKLNNLKGPESLAEQAKKGTSGIQTAVANLKNAVVRAVAEVIETIGHQNIVRFINNIQKAIVGLFPYIGAFVRSFVVAVNIIASVLGKIGRLFGGLFGKKQKKETKDTAVGIGDVSYAIGGIGDSADKATGSAKKLNKELGNLQGFDEMNVLQDPSSSGGGSGGSGGGGDLSDLGDLGGLNFGNISDQMKELAKYADLCTSAIWGLIGAFIAFKLTGDLLKSIGIGLMIMGIVYAIQGLIKYLKDPSWKSFGQIIQGIGIAIIGLGVAVLGLPGIIVGAIVLIVGTITKYWDEISAFLSRGIEKMLWKSEEVKNKFGSIIGFIYDVFVATIQNVFKGFDNFFKGLRANFDGFITFIKGVFTGNWKQAWEGIKQIFSGSLQSMKGIAQVVLSTISGIVQTIARTVGSAISSIFKGVINAVLRTIENQLNKPIDAINSLLSVINAVPGIKLGKLSRIRLPRLAKGGIINQPGRGVAIAGERGAEGVIPLTDSQQMAMLGEAIGRYITVNANITNTMNGRVISRELQKINNESDFAFNR